MGAIKDLHDLTAGLLSSVKDRKIVADLYKILDAISSFQSEHFEARERNVNLLADNCRLQQEIRDLQSNHTAAIRDLTASHAKTVSGISAAHAAEIKRLAGSHAQSVASLKHAHSEEVARLNRRIAELTPKPVTRMTGAQLAARTRAVSAKPPFNPIASGSARTRQANE